jgi:hypothetical protein
VQSIGQLASEFTLNPEVFQLSNNTDELLKKSAAASAKIQKGDKLCPTRTLRTRTRSTLPPDSEVPSLSGPAKNVPPDSVPRYKPFAKLVHQSNPFASSF